MPTYDQGRPLAHSFSADTVPLRKVCREDAQVTDKGDGPALDTQQPEARPALATSARPGSAGRHQWDMLSLSPSPGDSTAAKLSLRVPRVSCERSREGVLPLGTRRAVISPSTSICRCMGSAHGPPRIALSVRMQGRHTRKGHLVSFQKRCSPLV